MSKCTSYDYIHFDNGILDNIIDAVYVILLKKSHRTSAVYRQINEYKLSKNNFIQINEKFTECEVSLNKQLPSEHIIYNTVNILKHANNNNFNNILVFQDDFILDREIKDKEVINDLEVFINNNDFSIYYIGCLPIIFNPFEQKHHKSIFSVANHSVIYSKYARDILIHNYNKNNTFTIEWYKINLPIYKLDDIYYNFILNNKYFYHKPLCYQVFEETDNKKQWTNSSIDFVFNIMKLDKDPEYGFHLFYKISFILNILVIFFILYLFLKIINKLTN